MKIFLTPTHKVIEERKWGELLVFVAGLCDGVRAYSLYELCFLVYCKQIGNFSGVEQTVDIFQEGFVFDLGICEQECCGFALSSARTENLGEKKIIGLIN